MMHQYVGTEHLLIGLLRVESCVAGAHPHRQGLQRLRRPRGDDLHPQGARGLDKQKKELPFLAEYGRDLTQLTAHQQQFDPLIGREKEVERIIQILSRRTKNNPILLGEPGVGKTAIVEGLAQRIVDGNVPLFIANKRILSLDLSLIVAGTKYRGQFEERLKGIIKELKENQDIIIFIDEIHSLIGAGSAEGSLDAANILKPALSRGEISCIGATTHQASTAATSRRTGRCCAASRRSSSPADRGRDLQILEGVKERYEQFHKVKYCDDGDQERGLPVQPLHHRPLLPRQGDRHPRRGRRQGEAASRVADTQNLRRLEARDPRRSSRR